MRRSDMGKGATLRQGSKGPKLKLAGTTHRAQEVIYADLHQEIWGLSPTELHPTHTHIKDSTSPPGFRNATVLLPRGQKHWVPHWLPRQIHSLILVSFTDSFLPSRVCTSIHSSHICPIHSSSNSDYLLASPCIHSFMLLTDLNIKSISFINSVSICNKHLLCPRRCLRLRGHRRKQSS